MTGGADTRRVCLLSPGHLARNPRLVREADALAEAGYQVSVISGDYDSWARAADEEFHDRPWRSRTTLPFGPEAPFLRRAVQTLRRHGARAIVKRTRSENAALVRAAVHPVAPDLAAAARSTPADLYIAHYVAALPAAAQAAALHGSRYGFDAEDFHPGDLPDAPEHAFENRLIRAVESRYLPGCAHLTAASPGIADAYAETYGVSRPTVVLNVSPRSLAPDGPTPNGIAYPGPSVYWFSQTIGPDRGLECAVRAIGLSGARPHLYLRGSPAPGFRARLMALAAEAGSMERVHLLSPALPSRLERLAAVYDIGLVGETGRTRSRGIALTNKMFSYLTSGLSIAATDIPAHRDAASAFGPAMRLYPTDDAHALAVLLDSLLLHPERLAASRAKAWRLGQERFSWERERDALVAAVDKTLGRVGST